MLDSGSTARTGFACRVRGLGVSSSAVPDVLRAPTALLHDDRIYVTRKQAKQDVID